MITCCYRCRGSLSPPRKSPGDQSRVSLTGAQLRRFGRLALETSTDVPQPQLPWRAGKQPKEPSIYKGKCHHPDTRFMRSFTSVTRDVTCGWNPDARREITILKKSRIFSVLCPHVTLTAFQRRKAGYRLWAIGCRHGKCNGNGAAQVDGGQGVTAKKKKSVTGATP